MKPKNTLRLLGGSLATLLASSVIAYAATNTWNIGTGNWDTSTSNWTGGLWSNDDDAVFGGLSIWESAGGTSANQTITINESTIQANSLTFNYSGVNIAANSTHTLTLTGSATITVNQVAQGPETNWSGGNSYVNTISAPITGSAGLTKLGVGVLNLTGANMYSGTTTVSGGILRLNSAGAIKGGVGVAGGLSALTINGGVLELEGIGNFSRGLGSDVHQFQIPGGTSGFSARGAARTVNIGNASATVQWGSADFNPTTLVLNEFTANSNLIVSNGIDLNGTTRTIRSNSVGTGAFATISGVISDSAAAGVGLTKTGTGVLELSNANTYGGTTTVSGGILRLSNATALPGGIGATGGTSALTLNGGVVELANGDFLRNVDTGSAEFQITGGISGFSARGATRNVTVNNAASQELDWGTSTFNPSVLLLNDVTADNQLNLNNKIDLNGAIRTIAVNGTSSFANIAGEILDSVGGGGLTKIGPGILRITTPVTYTGLTNIKGGTLELGASDIFPNNAPLRLGVNDAQNSSLGGGTFASTRGGTSSGNGASPGAGWARLDMKGFSDTVGTVTVDGMNSFLIGGGGTLTSTGSFEIKSGQVLAALAGTGINLNKTSGGLALLDPQVGSSGNGSAVMSNTYTGTTTISGGVLRIFNLNAIPGGIATTGGLSALTINGGVLELGFDNAHTVVDFTRDLGNTSLTFQIPGGRSGFSAWAQSRNVNIGGGSNTVAWGSTYFNPSTLVLQESSGSAAASSTLTFQNPLDLGTSGTARTIEVMSNHTTARAAIVTGVISDTGAASGLTKSGVGILILNSSTGNTYGGLTTVKSGGGLQIQHNTALGATGVGSDTTVEAGAALRLDSGLTNVAENITLNGMGIVNNSFQMLGNTTGVATGMYQPTTLGSAGGNTGALRNIGNTNTITGVVTLASASRIQSDAGTLTLSSGVTGTDVDLTVGGSGDTTITAITTGTGSLTVHGQTAGSTSGVLTLTGASGYSGTTTVRKGTINVASTGSINGATGTPLDFTGNGIFKVIDASQNMGALTFSNGAGTVFSSRTTGSRTQTFTNYTAPAAGRTATFITDGGTIGTDNKIVLSAGQSTGFMGKNVFANFASGVTIGDRYAYYDGFVRAYTTGDANYFAAPGAPTMGAATTDNVELGGAITAQTTTSVNTINLGANAFTVVAADTVGTDGLLSKGGTFGPSTSFLQPKTSGGELVVQVPSGTLTVQSVIQNNTNPSSLTKSGAGTVDINGAAPTYTGKTTVAGGILKFSNINSLGTIPSTEIVVDSGELQMSTSDYYVGNNAFAGGTSNNKITVQNGGKFAPGGKFYIGYGVNADNNTITVDGIGSQLTNSGGNSFLWLGFSGSSNKIVVSNGGYYGANGGNAGSRHYVGENMGADSNTIEVKGAGSLFETSGNNWLTIGGMGNGNGAAISTGGMMWTGALSLGGTVVGVVGGSSNTVTIADAGSLLLTRKSLSIGRGVDAASNGITVSNGGMLYTQAQNNSNEAMHVFELGASTGANNNFITVTGAGSRWMADYGWDANGGGGNGNVTNTNVGLQSGVIGYAETASGNKVNVLDGGLWAMNARLEIGGVNSEVNLGNGIGATASGIFSDVVMNTASAKVKINKGQLTFSKDTGSISGLGQVQLDGPATVSTELVAGTPTNNSINTVIAGGVAGTLTKVGAGTLTLTADNTYTGNTTIKAGTLKLDGSGDIGDSPIITVGDMGSSGTVLDVTTKTGGFTVGIGQTLSGIGTVNGSTTIAGSHSPGNSAGIQTFTGGLEYAATSKLLWELNDDISTGRGSSYDGVDVTGGAFSITSGATIDLSFGGSVDFLDSFWDINQSWKVVDLSGSVTGDGGSGLFSVGTFTGATPSGGSFSVSRVSDGTWNDVFLNWVASAGGPSYATWAAAFSSPVLSDQAADADPDFDGLENALEYVIGSDPRVANQGGPTGGVVGTNLVLNLTRKDSSETADVGLLVQVSTDLVDWTTITGYTIGADNGTSSGGVNITENLAADDTISVTIPKGADVKKFARLRVVITP